MTPTISRLGEADFESALGGLANVLTDCVSNGAAIGMVLPFDANDARIFWRDAVYPDVRDGSRALFVARDADDILGTVQLITGMPSNQPHRCEIAKMMVSPAVRRRGIGRMLMNAALDAAKDAGKRTVTLDTRSNDVAQPLYEAVGFKVAGEIPDFAFDPDGQSLHATTYMYLLL